MPSTPPRGNKVLICAPGLCARPLQRGADQGQPSPPTHDSYSHWWESDNDDLVLAVSQGVWFRQWMNRHTDTLLARKLQHTKRMQGAMPM